MAIWLPPSYHRAKAHADSAAMKTAYDAEVAAWHKAHSHCPQCGTDDFARTCVGTIYIPGEPYRGDSNHVRCACGFRGPVSDCVPEFPPYVRMGDVALCHSGGGEYYRHAGNWEVRGRRVLGKLMAFGEGQMAHVQSEPLTVCTEAEWREDNGAHAPAARSRMVETHAPLDDDEPPF